MHRDVQARNPGKSISIGFDLYKRACSPGADVEAVWFRVSLVGIVEMLGMLRPWVHEGVVADAVFRVAATFPTDGIKKEAPGQGLPFDVQEFISQVTASAA